MLNGSGSQAAAFEDVIGGGGNDNIVGNASGNRLLGGGGNDTLDGRGGNDLLVGGAGHDTHIGGSGMDTFSYQGTSSANDLRVTVAPGTSLRLERRAVGQTDVLETDVYFTESIDLFLLAALGGNDIIGIALDVGFNGTVDGGSGTDTCVTPPTWTKLSCER